MNRDRIALVRFGYGPRLGEPLPRDPDGWLVAQIARAGTPPTGVGVPEAIRTRAEAVAERRARGRMEAQAAATGGAMQESMQANPPGRSPLAELTRNESIAWADRRLKGTEPFRERLVDFWMNHFTVSRRANVVGALNGPLERDAIRPHLTARFADMLVAVTRHPAMLLYLDNAGSIGPDSDTGQRRRRGLNENLAREVLELHTLSPAGGYTQGDVQELAKILTGWSVALEEEPFDFLWRPAAHQPGPKVLLGRRFAEGPDSQEAALRFLGTHPATYRHLAVKLARHFIADDPPPAAVRALEETLRRTEGDLAATYRVLVARPEVWEAPLGKFRAPVDYVLAAARAAGLDRGDIVVGGLGALGQPLWTAPQPNGWPDVAEGWAAPEAVMRRIDWAYTFAGRLDRRDPAAITEAALGPFARAETVAAMRVAGSVRDALTLLFGSPEFMHR
jgi:uncharacterized protein (DUF1800 family)